MTQQQRNGKAQAQKTTTVASPSLEGPTPQETAAPEVVVGLHGASSVNGQAAMLQRLPAVQRQAALSRIARTQGNAHVQRLVLTLAPATPTQNRAPAARVQRRLGPQEEEQAADLEPEGLPTAGAGRIAAAPPPPPDDDPTSTAMPDRENGSGAANAAATAVAPTAVAPSPVAPQPVTQSPPGMNGQGPAGAATGSAATTTAGPAPAGTATAPSLVETEEAQETEQGTATQDPGEGGAAQPSAAGAAAGERSPQSPQEDPGFQAVAGRAGQVAAQEQQHQPAGQTAAAAQAAAASPSNEVHSQAAARQVGEMDAQQPQPFDQASFKARLMERIQAQTPQTLEDADNFASNNNLDSLRGELSGEVDESRDEAEENIESTAEEAPDTAGITPRQAEPLAPEQAGEVPTNIGAAAAAPPPRTAAEVEAPIATGSQSLDEQMAAADVSEEQLANANEPAFTAALDAKQTAQTSAAESPGAYRQEEAGLIASAQSQAETEAAAGLAAMHGERDAALGGVEQEQTAAQTEDEVQRAEIAAQIESIYEQTRAAVDQRLEQLDQEVDQAFTRGAEAAQARFENHHRTRMQAYKNERYSGLDGAAQWVVDKFLGLPPEVNAFYTEARDLYIAHMDGVIDEIARLVATGLTEAKGIIAEGRQQVQEYVLSLPQELQEVGAEAAQAIQSRFDELEQQVAEKENELIDSLAQRYTENLQQIDARIEALQAENRGLVDRALDLVGGVIQTIVEMKNMLLDVLSRAAAVVESILRDPIGFLGNLVDGVKAGLEQFISNIATHLQSGFIGWLTGALGDAGITLPETWDLAGIFQLVMQVLGISFENIMGRVSQVLGIDIMGVWGRIQEIIGVYQEEGLAGLARYGLTQLIGEENVAALMQVVEIVQMAMEGNLAALWEMVQGYLGELRDLIFGQITEFLVERVIKAGVTWIISLLNPAGAFIRACKAIYDIVMFFIERGSQIMSLVNAIIGSLSAIVSGNIGAMATAVENALARAIPVAISFLASLLGLGGISDKVREIVERVRGLVDRALDAVLNSRPVQMVAGFIRSVVARINQVIQRGINAVGSALGLTPEEEAQEEQMPDERSPDEKQQALTVAVGEAHAVMHQYDGREVEDDVVEPALDEIRRRHRLKSLDLVPQGEKWSIRGEVNPIITETTDAFVLDNEPEAAVLFHQLATEAEREFFELGAMEQPGPLDLNSTERQMSRAVGRGGRGQPESMQLEGISSREYIQSRMRVTEAFSRVSPGGGMAPAYEGDSGLVSISNAGRNVAGSPMVGYQRQQWGDINVSSSLQPTAAQPENLRQNWIGQYDLGSAPISTAKIAELQAAGLSERDISELMQQASSTGRAISESDMRLRGYRGSADQLRRHRGFLLRLVQLTMRVEPMRFMGRGFNEQGEQLPHQPVALSTVLGHQLVQGGAAPLGSVLGAGDMVPGQSFEEEVMSPTGMNPVALRGSATNDIAIVGIMQRVRQAWSRWKLEQEQGIRDLAREHGVADPHLVPTKATMLSLLRQFYGEETRQGGQ